MYRKAVLFGIMMSLITFSQVISAQESTLADFGCTGEYKLFYRADTLYEYTGTDSTIEIELLQLSSDRGPIWVKRKMVNCTPSPGKDCTVWCLEDRSASKQLRILTSPTATTDKQMIVNVISHDGDVTTLPEVCKEDITPELLSMIAVRLHEYGYLQDNSKTYKKLKGKLKKAWHQFQKDYALGVGGISEVGVFVLIGE